MIFINEVYMNVNNNEYIRIIDIDSDIDVLYFVVCYKSYAYPKSYKMSVFIDEINSKMLLKVPDMFQKVIDESSLNEREIERRDYYWQIVDRYWKNNKAELLSDRGCRKIFKSISEEHKISESSVKRIFSRFFERGMNKNSLLTQYSKSGGKGKERNLGLSKTGRPKKYNDENKKSGINITDDIKIIFQHGIDKFYNNKKMNSLRETYIEILKEYFSYKYIENGEMKYSLIGEDKLPTYGQFYYWFRKNKGDINNIINRQSENDFNLKERPLLSNSIIETVGPGTRFQIDATVADIYLVSKFDRDRIIGRPIVYVTIDVYSRMVTGIYVGLEGPSWLGAMMALDNMVANKVEFCEEYGIEIKEYQWPAHHLPQILLADRGEFEGYSPENLINNLGIVIENTAPYRGDLKGIVERKFRTINTKIKHMTPGAIMKEYRKRGDRDYRLDAQLTVEEFTKQIIGLVLYHNSKIIDKYPMEIDMISNEIVPIPYKLWQWGIENKKGSLRVVDREIMRLNVLPRAKASVPRSGIRFRGDLFYSNQRAIHEQWFVKNKIRSINIIYDPRNVNFIYIPDDDGRSFDKCYLLETCVQYKDAIIEEVIFFQELQQEVQRKYNHDNLQEDVDFIKYVDSIINTAIKEKKNNIALINQSNTAKLRDIKKNRMIEKEVYREREKFELDKQPDVEIDMLTPDQENKANDKVKDIFFEKVRKKRIEKLEKDE